jgi:hypothetical protein
VPERNPESDHRRCLVSVRSTLVFRGHERLNSNIAWRLLIYSMKVTAMTSSTSDKEVTGYSILEADSMGAAVAMLQGHPHLDWAAGCEIEVHEAMPVPVI